MAYVGVVLFVGAFVAWFFSNRTRRMEKGTCAGEYQQKLSRRKFGLSRGERLTKYFNAEMYIGPLRPDVSPSKEDSVLSAMVGQGYRGAVAAVCLTDRGRLAIAIERADEASLDDELSNDTGEGTGMEPLVIYAHPKPRIRRGEQVWAGNRKYPATTQAPLRPGIDGRVARFHLLHIESPHSQPLTIWVEPLCAEALLKWAVPETQMGYAAVAPQLSR